MNKVQDSFPVEVSDDDVLYQPISHCTLCESNYPDEPSLSRHLQTNHTADAFRCVACVDSVSLFPSYAAAASHSNKEHHVSYEAAIQSSILLPVNLVKYRCKLCTESRERTSEESIRQHLQVHSSFFAKRWKKNSQLYCRICEKSLDEPEIESHCEVNHPRDLFADEDDQDINSEPIDTSELQSDIQEQDIVSECEQLDSIHESEKHIKGIRRVESRPNFPNQVMVWDSFKPDNLLAMYFPKSNVVNNNVVEKAPVADKKKPLEKNLEVPEYIKSERKEPETRIRIPSETSESVQPRSTSNSISPRGSHPKHASLSSSSSCDQPSVGKSSKIATECETKKQQSKLVTPPKTVKYKYPKYKSAVIPLPCFPYPIRQLKTGRPQLYSCNVCTTQSSSALSLVTYPFWIIHRETVDHRKAYSTAFFENDCRHFADAFYNPSPTTHQALYCHRCNIDFSERREVIIHYRSKHSRTYSNNIHEPYCYPCQMPLPPHHHHYDLPHEHNHEALLRESHSCPMCDMRVFTEGRQSHIRAAHTNQLFQCKLGLCLEASEGDRGFMIGYALHFRPAKLLQHQALTHQSQEKELNSTICYFPNSVVSISCQKCQYYRVGEEINSMIHHLKYEHKLGQSDQIWSDLMTFSCRVCEMSFNTMSQVIRHAKKYRWRTRKNDENIHSEAKDEAGEKGGKKRKSFVSANRKTERALSSDSSGEEKPRSFKKPRSRRQRSSSCSS